MGRNNKARRAEKKRERERRGLDHQRRVADRERRVRDAEDRADRAHLQEGLAQARTQYADKWATSSELMDRDGHYEWMASFLASRRDVLEIGTGEGRSTLVLARKGHAVVGIDENAVCLDRAEARLSSAGIPVTRLRREQPRPVGSALYELDYAPVKADFPSPGTVLLIEGDLLRASDPGLNLWLSAPRFDAIACWCIGTHEARDFNAKVGPKDEKAYRFAVQNGVYELADRALVPGGVLQVVDRAGTVTDEVRHLMVACHDEQASVTSLKVDRNVSVRPYALPAGGAGCQMVFLVGKDGRVPDVTQMNLTSILAFKPALA